MRSDRVSGYQASSNGLELHLVQFRYGLEPVSNSWRCSSLDRATPSQANQPSRHHNIVRHCIQGFPRGTDQEGIDLSSTEVRPSVQIQLETQFLELINTEFLAQAA